MFPAAQPGILSLVSSMTNRHPIALRRVNDEVVTGVVNAIQAEDNSGTSFNILIALTGSEKSLHSGDWLYFKEPVGDGVENPITSLCKISEKIDEHFIPFCHTIVQIGATIRTCGSGISPNIFKDLIKQRYDVMDVCQLAKTTINE